MLRISGCKPGNKNKCGKTTLARTSYCPPDMKLVAGECLPDFNKIIIYDNEGRTADRYTVLTSEDVFSMSSDALMPNGVNMYVGARSEYSGKLRYLGRRLRKNEIPAIIKEAVKRRLKKP